MSTYRLTLLLLRHGNTFASGDKVVMVGASQDLPLVDKGREQAQAVRDRLTGVWQTRPTLYTAPLARTREYAQIVSNAFCESDGEPLIYVDERLKELDYGTWAVKTDEEIRNSYGSEALEGWRKRGIWPREACFGEGEESVITRVHSFADDLVTNHRSGELVVAVSSQGVLRYFLTLVDGAFSDRASREALSVATGRGAVLRFSEMCWHLDTWNASPEEMAICLQTNTQRA